MTAILIVGVIGGYSLWVIRKKYRDMKNGKFCGGCCRDCQECKRR